jgi:hypothetical protein
MFKFWNFFNRTDTRAEMIRQFPDSVQINRLINGYTWTIKVRADGGDHDRALSEVKRIDQELRKKYRKEEADA